MIPVGYLKDSQFSIFEEFKWRDQIIRKGDTIRVRFKRGEFTFLRAIYDSKTNREWFDCKERNTGKYYSFYIYKMGGLKT